jgi:hypothetical protein
LVVGGLKDYDMIKYTPKTEVTLSGGKIAPAEISPSAG